MQQAVLPKDAKYLPCYGDSGQYRRSWRNVQVQLVGGGVFILNIVYDPISVDTKNKNKWDSTDEDEVFDIDH